MALDFDPGFFVAKRLRKRRWLRGKVTTCKSKFADNEFVFYALSLFIIGFFHLIYAPGLYTFSQFCLFA
jgi:hypothetical protein